MKKELKFIKFLLSGRHYTDGLTYTTSNPDNSALRTFDSEV